MADITGMLQAAAGVGGAEEADPNFNQTVLLLHGDGTDGAQNNTFLDSSTNNFTITRNGNTTQGTFSPFSVADGAWSNYFDGSGDYLSIAYDSAFLMGTSTDFCIEGWVYPKTTTDVETIYGSYTGATTGNWIVWFRSNKIQFYQFPSIGVDALTTTTVPLNAWSHFAITRSGTTFRIFLNGVEEDSVTGTYQVGVASNAINIGRYEASASSYFDGYISSLRHVVGDAVYTASFTPSTTPLTAISNTQLLTCQSNRFVDNSSNAFAITVNGNTSVQPFSPFAPSAAYSPTTNGGSGYFDGTGDYLAVGSASDWTTFHNGSDWTAQFWIFHSGTSAQSVFGTTSATAQIGFVVRINEGSANVVNVYFLRGVSGSFALFTSNAALKVNQWNHVAITFENSGKTCTFYINGVQEGSSSNTGFSYSASAPTNTFNIGGVGGNAQYIGYLSNLRLSTNIRTGLTSVPATPFTSDANTSLLCNFTNVGIFDNTGKNNLETVGNAQVDTSTKKFGTGSLEFDGTGDWLKVPNSADIQLGTGDFTIEFWVYLASGDTGSNRGLVAKGGASTGWLVSLNTTEKVVFTYTTSTITSSGAITTNAWNHIAVVREGTGSNETKIYIGGTNDGTGTVSTDFNQTEVMYIGANRAAGDPMKGFIDDLRITKGVARYTTTFTPPTKAFPDL